MKFNSLKWANHHACEWTAYQSQNLANLSI